MNQKTSRVEDKETAAPQKKENYRQNKEHGAPFKRKAPLRVTDGRSEKQASLLLVDQKMHTGWT